MELQSIEMEFNEWVEILTLLKLEEHYNQTNYQKSTKYREMYDTMIAQLHPPKKEPKNK